MSRSVHIASFIVLGLTSAACGVESSLVGGSCKPGYTEYAGSCVISPSGSGPTFESNDDGTREPTISKASSAVKPGQGVDELEDPIHVTPGTKPPPGKPDPVVPVDPVDPVDPVLVCEAPLVACQSQCISVESDPTNCGACGRVCASNICSAGTCVGATPGDVVLIGHDMTMARLNSAQARVLTNAVSIPTANPIRILSYEAGAEESAWNRTRTIIKEGITRPVEFSTATVESLESDHIYTSFDVVVVHGAAGSDPTVLGGRWATALQEFTYKGGVVVAIDDGTSDVPSLVNATGLLQVAAHMALSNTTQFLVTAPGDVVGAQVLSPYAAFGASVGFVGIPAPNADLTWVVQTDNGSPLPTVVHKVARRPIP